MCSGCVCSGFALLQPSRMYHHAPTTGRAQEQCERPAVTQHSMLCNCCRRLARPPRACHGRPGLSMYVCLTPVVYVCMCVCIVCMHGWASRGVWPLCASMITRGNAHSALPRTQLSRTPRPADENRLPHEPSAEDHLGQQRTDVHAGQVLPATGAAARSCPLLLPGTRCRQRAPQTLSHPSGGGVVNHACVYVCSPPQPTEPGTPPKNKQTNDDADCR